MNDSSVHLYGRLAVPRVVPVDVAIQVDKLPHGVAVGADVARHLAVDVQMVLDELVAAGEAESALFAREAFASVVFGERFSENVCE